MTADARFTVAAAQMCSTDDLAHNLATVRRLAAEAAARGAALFALPECFAFIGRKLADKLAVAESLEGLTGSPNSADGPIVETVREIATTHGMWVVAGGLPEKLPGGAGDRVYNTCLVVDGAGQRRAAYRKIHLFDVAIPGRAELCESASTAAGHEVVVSDTPVGKLGLSICYDVRFPELYRQLALEMGAEVLMVPAAFTAHTGAAHWHTLLKARAIENQCWVVAPAQHGRHNEKRESFGHTVVIDPWGQVVAEVERGDGLAVAEIDRAAMARVREQMPCATHAVLGPGREG